MRTTIATGEGKDRTAKDRDYRRRLAARGRLQIIADLPRETIAYLDQLKKRQGLRNRSQVLMQLIERGKAAIQQ